MIWRMGLIGLLVAAALGASPGGGRAQMVYVPGTVEEEDCAAGAAMAAEEDPAAKVAMGKALATRQAARAAAAARQAVQSGGDAGGSGSGGSGSSGP